MNTLLKGRLFKWDSQKGFGFIKPEDGSENIFIHISDFKDKSYRPIIGEVIIYKIGKGRDNRKKAVDAYSERKKLHHIGNINIQKNKIKRNSFGRKVILLVLLGIFILFSGVLQRFKPENNVPRMEQKIYKDTTDTKDIDEFLKEQDKFIAEHTVKKTTVKHIKREPIRKEIKRSCDRRQYCSQMRSCAEAKYFLNHCPGVKMDGDRDGIPCESQWCGH